MASQWEPAPYETHLRSAAAAHRARGKRRQPGSAGDREPASREPRHGQMGAPARRRGGSAAAGAPPGMGCCARPERASAPPRPPDDELLPPPRSQHTGAARSAAERSISEGPSRSGPSRPRGLEGSQTPVVLQHGGCGEAERPAARQSVPAARHSGPSVGTRDAGAAGAQHLPHPTADPTHAGDRPLWLETVRCAGRAPALCIPCLSNPCLLVLRLVAIFAVFVLLQHLWHSLTDVRNAPHTPEDRF